MPEVYLTQGKIAIVDNVDYERVSKFKWYAVKHRNTWYAVRQKRTGLVKPRQRTVRMHRFIKNASSGVEIDHRDGNGLNNRRENLRPTNDCGQKQNSRKPKNNTSGFKGVTRCRNKWQARLGQTGFQIHLGMFENREDAAKAYDAAALKKFGEFARLNFPCREAA